MKTFVEEIVRAYRKKVLFTRHALNQMNLSERTISRLEVYEVLENDKIVEDYPNDPRGHSCLLMGKTRGGRVIHVICAPKEDYLAIVTVYTPTLLEWEPDFKTRRRR